MAAVVNVATNTLESIQDLDLNRLKVALAQMKYQIGDNKMVGLCRYCGSGSDG